MRTLVTAAVIALVSLTATPAHAQTDTATTEVDCGESDGRVDEDGNGIDDRCDETGGVYPPPSVLPPTTPAPPASTTTTTTTIPLATSLPRTGGDSSVVLQVGLMLLVAGAIAVVATRRRSTAQHPEAA